MNKENNGILTEDKEFVSFYTYDQHNRMIKGKIIDSNFDNESQMRYYLIEPLEEFNGYKTIVRNEKEIF